MMKDSICEILKKTEKDQHIKILFACESGSRAWGFPSVDSDYDVRYIYTRRAEDYLSLKTFRDSLEMPVNNSLDINGWDLQKTLKLVYKSNSTVFEWLQSPVIYMEQPGFREELYGLCQHYFDRRTNVHHYLGISDGMLSDLSPGNEIKLKKLFYILRTVLSAKWCFLNNEIAPMEIRQLMSLMPDGLAEATESLIELKAQSTESTKFVVPADMMDYIAREMKTCRETMGDSPRISFVLDELNDFFRRKIYETNY